MNYQHKELAAGRWKQLTFVEQMANIGSEVERAFNWMAKNNKAYCDKAFERALELIDLTLGDFKNSSRFKEIVRVRKCLVDYFFGTNQFSSSEAIWRKYFLNFCYASRKNR